MGAFFMAFRFYNVMSSLSRHPPGDPSTPLRFARDDKRGNPARDDKRGINNVMSSLSRHPPGDPSTPLRFARDDKRGNPARDDRRTSSARDDRRTSSARDYNYFVILSGVSASERSRRIPFFIKKVPESDVLDPGLKCAYL